MSKYCENVIHTDQNESPTATAFFGINEVFYAACFIRCCFLLKRIKRKQSREGGVRRGRTRAIVAAMAACAFGMAFSAVSYQYKLVPAQNQIAADLSGKFSGQLRRAHHTLQTISLCWFVPFRLLHTFPLLHSAITRYAQLFTGLFFYLSANRVAHVRRLQPARMVKTIHVLVRCRNCLYGSFERRALSL
jgi:hypothetical protein